MAEPEQKGKRPIFSGKDLKRIRQTPELIGKFRTQVLETMRDENGRAALIDLLEEYKEQGHFDNVDWKLINAKDAADILEDSRRFINGVAHDIVPHYPTSSELFTHPKITPLVIARAKRVLERKFPKRR